MAAVRAGKWSPRVPDAPAPEQRDQTVLEFASEWLTNRENELRPRTVEDYRWVLSYHLLPHFAEMPVRAVTVAEIDRYKAAKLAEGRIAGAQINRTLRLFAQILDVAMEYGLIESNPARGRRRRVKAARPARTWVEPEQLMALLEAGNGSRAIFATMAGAGLRVGEAIALDWGDVNLATGVLTVRAAKPAAGAGREVDLPGVVDELTAHKMTSPSTEPGDPVFLTRHLKGKVRRQSDSNIRSNLKGAIRRAYKALDEAGIEPISESVSPHSLRRTYASLRAPCAMTRSTSPSNSATRTRRSRSASTRRRSSAVRGSAALTSPPSIRRSNGH